uniref:Uncharacterized protein n=1 Tax=Vitis vinifera TaxID=29760 RepID=F6HZ91_VITVI
MLIQRKRSQRRLLFLVKTLSTLYINETQLYSHQCLHWKVNQRPRIVSQERGMRAMGVGDETVEMEETGYTEERIVGD